MKQILIGFASLVLLCSFSLSAAEWSSDDKEKWQSFSDKAAQNEANERQAARDRANGVVRSENRKQYPESGPMLPIIFWLVAVSVAAILAIIFVNSKV